MLESLDLEGRQEDPEKVGMLDPEDLQDHLVPRGRGEIQ